MKVERLAEYVTVIVTVIIGIFLSLYLGASAGTGSRTPMLFLGGIAAVTLALFMQTRIWILIPLTGPLAGQLYGLPGNFPVRDLVMFYTFVVFLALKALKVVRTKPSFNWLDYLLWLNLFILALAYIRNPVGTNSIGAERMGGKPYVEVLFATCGYWVLHHVSIPKKWAPKFPLLMIAGSVFNVLLSIASMHIPFIANTIGKIYSGAYVQPEGDVAQADTDAVTREGYLVECSSIFVGLCCTYPALSLLNPFRFFRFLFSMLCIYGVLKSGFRSALAGMGLIFIFAVYFRNGAAAMLRILSLCAIFVGIIAFSQGTVVSLPPTIQRTLSFLPGKWDDAVIDSARGSTDWRHEIWANVWNSGHKYIKNWWFGDGFGMTKRDLIEMMNNRLDSKENLTIAGAYHSLPLTAIHAVGYVGFIFFTILIVSAGYYGWRLILKARGTPYFSLALLLGIPSITTPLPALFLTGFFDVHLIGTITSIGFLRLTERSLNQYLAEKQRAESAPPRQLQQEFGEDLQPGFPTR